MIRFLVNLLVQVVLAAIALLVAAWLVEGVSLQLGGFLVAVAVFALAQAILAPFVFNVARKYASAVLGGIGLVSTLLALWVASLFPGGITIRGFASWVIAALVVWVVTALGGWVIGAMFVNKWLENREELKRERKREQKRK